MKFKKLLAVVLSIAMVLSTMSFTVFAEETAYVAKVGDVECANVTEMLNALNAASGEVTVEIYGKLETSGFGINNTNIEKLSFVGKTDGAEIVVDGAAYIDVRNTNYPIEYSNLTLSHTNGAYAGDDCKFPDGVTALGNANGTTVTFNNCVFNNLTSGKYSLWVDGNGTNVIVNGGEFCGVRGAKLFAENGAAFSTLEVNGATFSNTITEKAAVVLTRGESVVLEDNTFNNTTDKVQVDDDYASEINDKIVVIDDKEYVVNSDNLTLEGTDPVATVNGEEFTDLQEAIKAAAPAGTVVIVDDVVVDKWIMFAETMSIGNGNLITLNINGMTINGNNHTLTIKSIESAGNGNRLFYDAENLNINNLTIEYVDAAADQGGIGLQSGTIENVNFVGGGNGILPGEGNITINDCEFATNGTAIYYEKERDNLKVTNNTFNQPDGVNVILLRGATEFTGNTVNSGRTVNVVSGSPVVTRNDFGDVRFKVYNASTATIEYNEINVLEFNDTTAVNATFNANIYSAEAKAALTAANVSAVKAVAALNGVVYSDITAAFGEATDGSEIVLTGIEDEVAEETTYSSEDLGQLVETADTFDSMQEEIPEEDDDDPFAFLDDDEDEDFPDDFNEDDVDM